MVCSRCKMVVESELKKLGLHPITVNLGEVEIKEDSVKHIKIILQKNLQKFGFDLIDDKKSKVIEKVKNLIIDIVHHKNNYINVNLSDYLTQNILQDYGSISSLFSEIEGITIEKYFINQKIEKIKELIMYNELSLSEIANQLNYSSVAHLSNQFKKATGFSPTFYKSLKHKKRKQIDNV